MAPWSSQSEDGGFTLVEIMVVVLIIGILVAVAIPTFIGSRGRADARGAELSLRNALAGEQTYFSINSRFGDTTSSPSIAATEPNLTWQQTETSAPAPNTVTVTVAADSSAGDSVYLQAQGKDALCYELFQTNGTVPPSGRATAFSVSSPTSGHCTSPTPLTGLGDFPTVNDGSASDHPGGGFYTSW